MGNKLQNDGIFARWTPWICFVLFLTMIASLFFSRYLLSVSMIAFFALSLFYKNIVEQARYFFANPLLWGMSLLFMVPLVSGLWSGDKGAWVDIIRIKLPLVLFPLAFAGQWQLSAKQWTWIGYFFIATILVATLWTFFQYILDRQGINESYLRAKTMVTPLENDHVRFSWLISTAILLSAWFFYSQRTQRSAYLFFFTATWFIIFLHLLAVRTGLISFYMMVVITSAWLMITKKKWITGIILIATLAVLPFIAYKAIPSFHNRVNFLLYEKGYFEKLNYLPGGNDAIRFISMKAGWNLMNNYPLHGTGFGDIYAETTEWYEQHYPGMKEADRIYPGSEWLIYGAGSGWPGLLVFTFSMLVPFIIPVKQKLLWTLLSSTAAFSFLFDIGLEVQFGVFIYAFVILWIWKWMRTGVH